MLYTPDELQAMKGSRVGDIINNMYKPKSKLNAYSKSSVSEKYKFTKYGTHNYDFSYTLRV